MARKSSIEKQKKRQKLVNLNFEKREALKKIVRSLEVDEEERLIAQNKLNSMKKNTSKVRLRNRCQMTGRSRGYLRKFQLSRLAFRELALSGMIPGIFKASW
ncbi:MAG: 30S ribosomal protein S14 [Simkaniaceae bacterium]|nr:30S ribosomal protein S14 [Simkaniaceae bacterium]